MGQRITPNTTTTSTFIVRFWREQAGAETRWRGRVEHVQSGQCVDFLAIEDLLGFFRRFGIRSEPSPADLPDRERRSEP